MKRLAARTMILLGVWCSCGMPGLAAVEEVIQKDAVTLEAAPADSPPRVLLAHQPILPKHRYLVEWMMNVEGEKRWRFLAEFAGVMVSFRDKHGAVIGESRRSTSCWVTAGWRSAWYQVETPARAVSLSVAFSI